MEKWDMKKVTAVIEEVVEKLTADEKLMAAFQKDPIAALEKVLGIDLPEEQIQAVLTGVKTKLHLDTLELDGLKNLEGLKELGKLFGGK